MKTLLLKTTLAIAALAIAVPVEPVAAQTGRGPAKKTAKSGKQTSSVDIVLDRNGTFSGYVLDEQGRPVANELVSIRQGPRRIAQTRTDATGQFRVARMRGGVYQVATKKNISVFRVWTAGAAPKSARQLALVVNTRRVVRGQSLLPAGAAMDFGTVVTTGVTAGSVALGVTATNKANDAEDQNAALQA